MKMIIPNTRTPAGRPRSALRVILIAFAPSFFAVALRTQAVSPAPDGGYPGGNTAEGQNALLSLTTGTYNTAVGVFSLRSNTNGTFNTAVGAGDASCQCRQIQNTAIGAGALLKQYHRLPDNTANGAFALFSNIATGNTAIGSKALLNNTTGGTLGNVNGIDVGPNVAVGSQALEITRLPAPIPLWVIRRFIVSLLGPRASSRPVGVTAVGFQALANATWHWRRQQSHLVIRRSQTTPLARAIRLPVFMPSMAILRGDYNTADGWIALQHNTTGGYNTAVGVDALGDNISGTYNIAVGYQAGQGLTTGSNNIYIGGVAGGGNEGQSNTITIGGTPDEYLHCRYKRHGARRWKSGFRRGRWSPRCGDFVAALQGKHPAYGQA